MVTFFWVPVLSFAAAALRIIWYSISYRIRMREANNIAVTFSMMIAFRLPPWVVAYRTCYALLLNMYAYLINDYFDIAVDLRAPDREQRKVQFMADHRPAARAALVGCAVALLAAALAHSPQLVIAFAAATLTVGLYSAWLKRVPGVDLLMMAVAGPAGTIIGIPDGRPLAWKLLGLLALISSSYQTIQIIRDEPIDRLNGTRTTAVALGPTRTAWVYRAILVAAAAYGTLYIASPLALLLVPAAFLPLTPDRATRVWDVARVVAGAVWLGLMVQVYFGWL
jgi:4-hydroxybenzoate polyprenyltransferase